VFQCSDPCLLFNIRLYTVIDLGGVVFGCGLGLQIQAMDSANVCMVQLELSHEGFDPYRCDKNIMLGIKLTE